ncbi:MAG: hypothetical protein ACP5II_00680 [Infirmifilum sp.]|uniref:hypothetical protein n=1 Tax=Infirmifilum sp. TaxID=2856575 RepID=UPI003D0D996D
MKYIYCSEKALRKLHDKIFLWYPYASFQGKNTSFYLLVDCVISSLLEDRNLRILLSRVVSASIIYDANQLPIPAGKIDHPNCTQEIINSFIREKDISSGEMPPVSFDLTDYLAARALGVPSALRKIDETFRAYASKTLNLIGLLENLKFQELEFKGKLHQLLALGKKGSEAYLVEGEKITRYRLLEKALKENKHISRLIFTKAQPLNHALK